MEGAAPLRALRAATIDPEQALDLVLQATAAVMAADSVDLDEPLLAIYADRAGIGSVPICVTAISDEEQIRLGEEGFGNVVGSPRPGGTLGVFIDDYLVWARTPPRGNRKGDPSFGQI